MKRSWLNLLSWASLAVVVGPAWAVKPEFWTHEQPSDFTAAELDNIVITNQGEVRLGRKSETLHAPGQEAEVINAIARAGDGKIYAASGPRGIIYRIDGDKVTQFATLPDGGTIFSLLFAQDGKLLAGTGGGPQARIHLIDGNGKVSLFYEPPGARYIWSMVRGPAGEIYVATGVEGKLFVVNADGTNGRLLADLKPKSLLCLAFGPDGSLYGGTDEDGLVYRINPASGKWYVLYDAKEPEISALVVDAAGNVYAATASAEAARPGRTVADTPGGKPDHSASAPATRPASDTAPGTAPGTNPGQPPASGTGADDEDDDEKEAKQAIMQAMGMPKNLGRAVPAGQSPEGGNAIYRIDIDGFVTEVFREPVMILDMTEADGTIHVATGNEGRIYAINPMDERTTMIARLKAEQATCLLRLPRGELILGTANPATLVKLSDGFAPKGTLTAKPLDAGQIVKWGRANWTATIPEGTRLTIATRSGNVQDEKSDAWEEWSGEIDATAPQQVASAGARFLQYRLTFESTVPQASATLRKLTIARIEENRPPQITELKVLSLSDAAKDPSSPPKVKGMMAGSMMGEGDGQAPPDRQWVIMWKADDPNKDTLRYEAFTREAGQQRWIRIAKDLKEPFHVWDTQTVPDGRHEIRVTTTDAPSNPPGTELSAARISDAIVVDNTPPDVTIGAVAMEGRTRVTVNATMVDALSNIAEASYTINSSDKWIPLTALDDIFDSPSEAVSFTIDDLTPGEHRIALRVRDAQGNTRYVTRTVTVGD